jgi:hypothetical protein
MPQKFAFTTAAMAAALEETPVSYEDLADIERDFDDAETDISELSDSTLQITSSSPQSRIQPKSIDFYVKRKDEKVAN